MRLDRFSETCSSSRVRNRPFTRTKSNGGEEIILLDSIGHVVSSGTRTIRVRVGWGLERVA